MSQSSNETMLSRIEHLERSNRVMKFIALGAVVACVALNAMPALSAFPHGPKASNAESFNLVSPNGTLIATLGRGPNGGYLAFFDNKGKAEMSVGTSSLASDKSFGVAAFDGNTLLPGTGKARLVWAVSSTAVGESIFDPAGHARLSLVTAGDGSNAGSFYYDSNQILRGGIGLGNNGPGAFFNDSTGTARLVQNVKSDDSAAEFAMYNTGATIPLFDLSALNDGTATSFQIDDHTAHTRLIEGFSTVSGEIIQLKDVNGAETFRAPCVNANCQ